MRGNIEKKRIILRFGYHDVANVSISKMMYHAYSNGSVIYSFQLCFHFILIVFYNRKWAYNKYLKTYK